MTDTLTYAGEELLSRTSKRGEGTLVSSTYAYNPDGLRSSATSGEGKVTSYAYDLLDELTEEVPAGEAATRYQYDAAGNRKAISGPAGSTAYSYNEADELTSNGSESLAYNPDGELSERKAIATGATTTYGWNAHGGLTSIDLPGGKTESFAYDRSGALSPPRTAKRPPPTSMMARTCIWNTKGPVRGPRPHRRPSTPTG